MTTTICPRERCTGCAACFNVCPKQCIHMIPDSEGFLYPKIDPESCDKCDACTRICPSLHLSEPDLLATPKIYACWNKDEVVRYQSASGGVFSALAGSVLDNGGVVFGASFNEKMHLRHIAITRKEELGALRSSKYIQSDIGSTFREIKSLLRQNRRVLFPSTPCQVAALNSFFGKDNENLLTCDMFCHGVPSPGLFARYVKYLEKKYHAKLVNLNLRDKRKGWEQPSTVARLSNGRECVLKGLDNSFLYGFLNNLSLRPACYLCPYTNIDRTGDITLGDFWGIGRIAPFHHKTRNGISIILVNTERGDSFLKESSKWLYSEKRTLEEAKYNRLPLKKPQPRPKNRELFFADYQRFEYEKLAKTHLRDKGAKGLIKSILPNSLIFYINKHIRKIR